MLVRDYIKPAVERLTAAGIESARLDARLLLAASLDRPSNSVFSHDEISPSAEQESRFDDLIERRANREPVSRILGKREFWSLDFDLGPDTLDPRPDSETLVEAVLELYPDRDQEISVLDLGTGTGCLLLAILSEYPNAAGTGVDLNEGAIRLAEQNARSCGLETRARFFTSSWFENVSGKFDLIISNPPYIPASDIPGLEAEVRLFDPALALDGGADGLTAYRAILKDLPKHLETGGNFVFEHGAGQENDIIALLEAIGVTLVKLHKDLSNLTRCVSGSMEMHG